MPTPDAKSSARHPFASYALMLALGFAPSALVSHFYSVLPHRLVVQWDAFGDITVIGTRSSTVLTIANVAAVIALTAIGVAIWQQRALVQFGMRRAYLGLNFAQIVSINLVCGMIVSDALGLQLKIKPMIPPAMAVLLFAAGVLCWRIDQSERSPVARAAALVLMGGGVGFLAFSAIAANAVVGYFASAFAALAMVALALRQETR